MTIHPSNAEARITFSILAEPGTSILPDFIAENDGDWSRALESALEGRGPQAWQPHLYRIAESVEMVRRTAARFNMSMVFPGDDAWPVGLNDLDSPPAMLYVRGDASILNDAPAMAIVGARAATGYGEHCAMEFSAGLSNQGVTIVSGGAYGIDGMAHRATLAASGKTVAVLAGGVDRFYPAGHEALLTRIVEGGVVISELPPGSAPTKWRFLQRNRIVAAMTQATLVVEAGHRSGSLNTAGHAVHLRRTVGAVPGPITSAASAGCHRLIKEGHAICITSAEEAFDLMPITADTEEKEARK
ncbi:DNA-processing protein DprA [Frigoribacterium sp. CG_9.8]|uniref:DNA-processing protein DprA n=1 Tax=Frigoribacterium sp. CG_9.8 TaxID=2787733 RepID=UPI0018CA6802|nr:DNA-processing protein DprA [Frigoribacterium sp. CG_9.8]MBG6106593.1 DNA protecting protein DprA [Frigoribacterium sp. CG_9.8]